MNLSRINRVENRSAELNKVNSALRRNIVRVISKVPACSAYFTSHQLLGSKHYHYHYDQVALHYRGTVYYTTLHLE